MYYIEKNFNKNIMYTFIDDSDNSIVICPSCGNKAESINFVEGCPFCRSSYFIDYDVKNYGANYEKKSYVQYIYQTPIFKIIVIILAIVLFLLLPNLTFDEKTDYIILNIFMPFLMNVLKFGFLLFLSYFVCSIILFFLLPILIFNVTKINNYNQVWEKINKKGLIAQRKDFFNTLNQELLYYYFSNEKYRNLIDFNIINYNDLKYKIKDNELYISITLTLNKIFLTNNKIKSIKGKISLILKYNNFIEENNNIRIIKCPTCGNSLDMTKKKCEFCHNDTSAKKQWEIVSFIKD